MNSSEVRVRFAPSPTGPLHIGGVRTALYNYLFARQLGGKMLLRIEDTDQTRLVPGAEEYILEALRWVGIQIDEGMGVGGPHAPYRQSERKEIYQQYAQQLVAEGKAYYAFDTPEELETMRAKLAEANIENPSYNAITRMRMNNALTLSAEEVAAKIAAGEPYLIRLKISEKEEVRFRDLIRDWVHVHGSTLDDKVLLKSDGMPTYHLANVVDDHLMGITHVIRGEEWLPSAPLHVLLYRAFGWEDTMPKFAHLPLLLKPEGHGKLSKRDADLGGFPVFPLAWHENDKIARGFREEGYLPEAAVNFLAFLGWNPGTEQEIFSMAELIQTFSLERISKSGAKFDINKAKWFNQQYLKAQSDGEIAQNIAPQLPDFSLEQVVKMVHLFKERVTFEHEIVREGAAIFEAPQQYDPAIVASKWTSDARQAIQLWAEAMDEVEPFEATEIKQMLTQTLEKNGIKVGKVMQPLRLSLTGVGTGPDLMLMMELMGKNSAKTRLQQALSQLP
jgi:glutamyl-tRNA synthetase